MQAMPQSISRTQPNCRSGRKSGKLLRLRWQVPALSRGRRRHAADSAQPRLPAAAFNWRRLFAAALATAALSACTALTTSYNNAPTLLTWMANSYFDLDGDQQVLLKDSLRTLRQWHRTQLPEYAKMLAEVQNRMGRPVEAGDVAWMFSEGEKRYRSLVERAAPAAAELAARLNHDNLAYLEKKLAKKNAEFERDFITADLEKRQDNRYDRLLDEAERWYGSFSREQKRKIRELSDALPANYPLVLENRKRRQAELIAILGSAIDKTIPQDQISRQLRHWAGDFEDGRSPAYRDFNAAYKLESEKLWPPSPTSPTRSSARRRRGMCKSIWMI